MYEVGHIATQLPLSQHPPLHLAWLVHVVPQWPLTHAVSVGQSVLVLQPQAPPTHAWPSDAFSQSTHASPMVPHVAGMVPSAQVPALQHEPMPQVPSFPVPHAPVHVPAEHVGVCPPHAWQAVVPAPHASLAVPGWHVVPSQQPLHARPPAQDVVQMFMGPQADPFGQSRTASMQPQMPSTHAVPRGDSAQSALTLHPHAPSTHKGPRVASVQSRQGAALPQLLVVPRHADESPETGPSAVGPSPAMESPALTSA
jgi:hypothetical protein